MFVFNNLEIIQVEVTSNCQASCPMCARNYHGGLPNPNIKLEDWTFEEFKTIISSEVLAQIKKIIFCGSFGDPILNSSLIDMCSYVKDQNSLVEICIHTNGSARSPKWWESLAMALPKRHSITFGIDGLEDTHHLHRIGTNFNTIIKNAEAFISAGGRAEWAFIKFKHNEHQVEEAEELAKKLKFKNFFVKESVRFIDNKFSVLDKNGNIVYNLEPASTNTIKFFTKKDIINYKSLVEESIIECQAKNNKELYIDYTKSAFPCCYTASALYLHHLDSEEIYNLKIQAKEEISNVISNIENIKLDKISIKELLNNSEWNSVWENAILDKPLVCVKNCGIHSDNQSTTSKQIVKKTNFKYNQR